MTIWNPYLKKLILLLSNTLQTTKWVKNRTHYETLQNKLKSDIQNLIQSVDAKMSEQNQHKTVVRNENNASTWPLHENILPFMCFHCDERFEKVDGLNSHISSEHEGNKLQGQEYFLKNKMDKASQKNIQNKFKDDIQASVQSAEISKENQRAKNCPKETPHHENMNEEMSEVFNQEYLSSLCM